MKISAGNYNSLIKQIEMAVQSDTVISDYAYIAKDLFAFFLHRKSIRGSESNLLKTFSYFVTSQKAHLYNMGYFVERIGDFSLNYEASRKRFKAIITSVLRLCEKNGGVLNGKTICYDDLYAFTFMEESISNVQIEIKSLHNLFKKGLISVRIMNRKDEMPEYSCDFSIEDLNQSDKEEGKLLQDYKTTLMFLNT